MLDTRKQKIQDLAAIYTNRFTAACFCDNLADEQKYCREATTWMLAQKAANNITNEELQEAIWALEKKAEMENQPFGYDTIVTKQ